MEKIPCTYFSNNFSLNITGLEDATCYYFQAYAVNSIGETVGEIMNFTTKQITIPNVSTTSSSNISYTSANISGYINSNGGSEISEYGFYYWVNSSSKFKVVLGSNFIGSYSKVLTGLIQNTTYYYQAYAINSKGIAYGNTSSFTTLYDPYNGHAYVDLGLPSGTKWATMNIGASSPSAVGSTFQWGCTVTGNQGNPMFNYEGCISGTEYDAATALWGGNWKIPTYTQALELFKYCTCQVIRDAGTTYYQLTSSLNNKTIILPAANHWTGNVGTYFSISYQRAYAFYGYGFLSESQAEREKSNQLSIRPVCK